MRRYHFKDEQYGDFDLSEFGQGGRSVFAVYGPGNNRPVKIMRTLRAARRWCCRKRRALEQTGAWQAPGVR